MCYPLSVQSNQTISTVKPSVSRNGCYDKNETKKKIAALWLFSAPLLAFTLWNPWFSKRIGYASCGVVVLVITLLSLKWLGGKKINGTQQEKSKQNRLDSSIKILEKDIVDVSAKIKKIDQFMTSHPDLKEISSIKLEEYKAYIVKVEEPSPPPPNSQPIDQFVFLEKVKLNLEFSLSERLLFIKRHAQVYSLFEKYVKEEQAKAISLTDETTPLLQNPL